MDSPALKSALQTILALVDLASQTALNVVQLSELRRSVHLLTSWTKDDPCFGRASWLATTVNLSGVLLSPPRRPSLPEQILSDCHFLIGYLDSLVEGISN